MASNILNNRTAQELGDAIRRLINDTDTERVVVPQGMLREMVIAQYILTQHEFGWNPQIPLRPTSGAAMLSYNLAAGDYQTTQQGESDIVAVGEVWIDRSRQPLQFYPREVIEGWINNDLQTHGDVNRGTPYAWTIRIDWTGAPPAEMKNRLLVYPAAKDATVIYWPRTVVDTEAIDPTSTGKMPLSYQGTWGLEFKIASILVRALDDEQLKKLRLHRGFADILWAEWLGALKREKDERASHVQQSSIQEYMS